MTPLRDHGSAGRWLHRKLWPLQQSAQRRVHDLRFLFLEITQRCNLSCRHCGSDCTANVTQPDLPAGRILEVLDGIRQNYDPSRITVGLSGGEPMLYPNVFGLGRAITDLGFPWGMVTNGWAWTPQKVEEADRAGMCTITVSLDGPPARRTTGCAAARARSNAPARHCACCAPPSGSRRWTSVTCVHRRNLHQLDATRDLLQELGVESWRLFTVSPIGRAESDPDLHLHREEYRYLMRWIAERRGTPGLAVAHSESGYLGACDTEVRDAPFFCQAGISVAGIMVDGAILACPNIDRSFAQGNVFEDDFCGIWEHGYAEFRDRAWMRTGDCVDCPEWAQCQGNSFHLWDPEQNRTPPLLRPGVRTGRTPLICASPPGIRVRFARPGPLPPSRKETRRSPREPSGSNARVCGRRASNTDRSPGRPCPAAPAPCPR